jgi:hypothetical protein
MCRVSGVQDLTFLARSAQTHHRFVIGITLRDDDDDVAFLMSRLRVAMRVGDLVK